MQYSTKPISTRCDIVRTIASVIAAACLLIITIGFLVAGTYTVRTVTNLQTTYHPEKLASIVDQASDTLSTLHKTTYLLKSGKSIPLLDDMHKLVMTMESMSKVLEKMPVNKMVDESKLWRETSTNLLRGVKKTLDNL